MMANYVEIPSKEVVLEPPVYCGNCTTEMFSLEINIFKCPACGLIYNYNTR